LFCGENGPDADLADELNWLREGRHYGFPWKFGTEDNPQASAKYDPSTDKRLPRGFFAVDNQLYKNDPSFPPRPSGIKFTDPVANTGPDADKYRKLDGREGDASQEGQPLLGITPHRSPLGLVFDSANALSGEYKGGLFMLSWGAAGGTLSDKGADLLLVRLTRKSDNYSASMTQIARNFALPIDAVLVNKTLYVLEFGGDGNIWAVQLP
jgi:glucose/arabinose dehydrogenase